MSADPPFPTDGDEHDWEVAEMRNEIERLRERAERAEIQLRTANGHWPEIVMLREENRRLREQVAAIQRHYGEEKTR